MKRTSLNISLPHSLKEYVEKQAVGNGYSTPSEYMRALIRDDERRRSLQGQLETVVLKRFVDQHERAQVTEEDWMAVLEMLCLRAARRNGVGQGREDQGGD